MFDLLFGFVNPKVNERLVFIAVEFFLLGAVLDQLLSISSVQSMVLLILVTILIVWYIERTRRGEIIDSIQQRIDKINGKVD